MANIPVERTGGGWWKWLVAVLILGGLIWLIAELFDDEPDAEEMAGLEDNVGVIDDVEVGDDDAMDDGIIVALDPLYYDYSTGPYAAGNSASMAGDTTSAQGMGGEDDLAEDMDVGDSRIGDRVDLDNVPVLSVVGDSAFFVGSGPNQRVLVVIENLGESEFGAGGSDGVYNIDAGETVSIDGTVSRYRDGARGTWDLPQADKQRLLQRGLYVRTNSRSDIEVSTQLDS